MYVVVCVCSGGRFVELVELPPTPTKGKLSASLLNLKPMQRGAFAISNHIKPH